MTESFGVGGAKLDQTHALRHTVISDHGACGLGGLLDVVCRARRRIAEDEFFGYTTTHCVHQFIKELVARVVEAVFGRHDHGVAERATTRQDRHFRDWVGIAQRCGAECVTTLVVGGNSLVMVIHHAGALLRAGNHAIDCFVNRTIVDQVRVRARCQQGCFVQNVSQVSAGETRGALRDLTQINVVGHGLATSVDLQDGFAALQVGSFNSDLTVKTTRAKKSRIQNVRAVRCSDHDDVRTLVEAVHFNQQLVQSLFTFVVATANAGATVATNCVDFVDEDDRGSRLLGALEQVANTRGTDADVEFHELRTGD